MTLTVWLAALLVSSVSAIGPTEDPRRGFIESWQGSRVVVARALYTVVYDEHGKLSRVYRGKRDGITVVAPAGVFFRFQPQGTDANVTGRDPQEVFDKMRGIYGRAGALDVLPFQRIEPSLLARYEPGVGLVVRRVDLTRNRVRIVLANEAATDAAEKQIATTLTIQWPADLSDSLAERPDIDRLIAQFLSRSPLVPGELRD